MIGIDLLDGRGEVAVCRASGTELVGRGSSLEELFELVSARVGNASSASAALAVPAWFHDGQRRTALERARAAGFENVGLVNRPTAAALAHRSGRLRGDEMILVLELIEGNLDVAVLATHDGRLEVLGADGGEIAPGLVSNADRLVEEIGVPVRRALETAEIRADDLTELVLVGDLQRSRDAFSGHPKLFGRGGEKASCPEHAVAFGAATFARNRPPGQSPPAPAPPQEPVVRESRGGCLSVLVVLLVAAYRFL